MINHSHARAISWAPDLAWVGVVSSVHSSLGFCLFVCLICHILALLILKGD